jgi:CubicO group peptidase (beta-lactamase class C family)
MRTISFPWLMAVFAISVLSVEAQPRVVVRLNGTGITPVRIDAAVKSAMRRAGVTGVGLAIFNRGEIAYLRCYGSRDLEKHLPLTPDSVMTAASLTKPAFATMVMELVEDRILNLDKPIFEYLPRPLPEYPRYTDLASDSRYKQITLRMLLDHTSGLPNWRWATEDKKLRMYFAPGSRFAYSGEGIELAQMVAEIVTKRPITELMNDGVFQPLGMTRTSMVWEKRFESDYANGYDEHGKSLGPQRRRTGDAAGGMQTTLRDYARFVQGLLDAKIPGQAARALMLSPQIEITSKHEFPSLDPETTTQNQAIHLSYGLGWGLYWSPYGKAFFKEGHDQGWRHYVVCFDKPRTGMLIMTNSSNGEDIYDDLLRGLIGDSFTPLRWEGFPPSARN